MNDMSDLGAEFERLKCHNNGQQRGYEFQTFVGSIFQREHFSTEMKARTARQIDIFASRAEEMYLVETKWRQKKVDIGDVDSLLARLESTSSSVTGLLASYSGFTKAAIDRVGARANRPIVLLSGTELERLFRYDGSLSALLRQKHQQLVIHNAVMLDCESDKPQRSKRREPANLKPSETSILFPDDSRRKSLHCRGDFGAFVFVKELPDVDWVLGSGVGVAVDVAVPVDDEGDITELLRQLSELGWTTTNSRWSIQQATRTWHGMGESAFVEALSAWRERYEGIETHHSEEFSYFDVCDGGFYTLTANITAYEPRIVRQAHLSFQLVGVPLDTKPLRHLCDTFNVEQPVYFRPLNQASVERLRHWGDDRAELVALMPLVEYPDGLAEEEWVTGIVARNPYYERRETKPEWLPDILVDSEYLICDLRSWHERNRTGQKYHFWALESARTSDALVVRVVADWTDD